MTELERNYPIKKTIHAKVDDDGSVQYSFEDKDLNIRYSSGKPLGIEKFESKDEALRFLKSHGYKIKS